MDERTGRAEAQDVHLSKPLPEHVAQSGWHGRHELPEENVLLGHEETQVPLRAKDEDCAQDRQKALDPAHVLHDESHAMGCNLLTDGLSGTKICADLCK